jgi:hypothetical protein
VCACEHMVHTCVRKCECGVHMGFLAGSDARTKGASVTHVHTPVRIRGASKHCLGSTRPVPIVRAGRFRSVPEGIEKHLTPQSTVTEVRDLVISPTSQIIRALLSCHLTWAA